MSEYGAPLPLLARYAVMVDVGYIFAAAGELLLGTSSRRDFRVDAVPLIHAVSKHADELVRGELLRVYWYDAARDRVPTIDQRVIAQMPLVKLRLGNLNARGQQKGVDAQIRADMEALARHHAITDAVLVAGDEDMVPAVEAAQAYGVRVHLWGIEPPYGTNQAERLVWESDTVEILDSAFVKPYFTRQPASVVETARPDEPPASAVPSPRSSSATGSGPAARQTGSSPYPGGAAARRVRAASGGRRAARARSRAARRGAARPGRGPARPGPVPGRGGRRARSAEVDPDPRHRQHPRPAPRPDPAAGHRQGAAGRGGEGARPVAALLPGGARMAAGRVLGPGPPRVRHHRGPLPRLRRAGLTRFRWAAADAGPPSDSSAVDWRRASRPARPAAPARHPR